MSAKSSFNTRDVYATVTNEIVQAIEAGAPKFQMPWHEHARRGFPRNAATGNVYHGINTLALWATSRLRGYGLPYWATYRQWEALGARVRRGERSSIIVFYKRKEGERNEAEVDRDLQERGQTVLRYSCVFNGEQVDDWSYPTHSDDDRTRKLQHVDAFVSALGAQLQYGCDRAYYSKAHDRIYMPDRRDFIDRESGTATEGFYSVLLHEHVHWTGHPSRLNRDLSGRFGSEAYAMEELVAELGAAFLCADLGISVHPRRDHAAYVASWLKVLKQQKAAIFTAAGTATAAGRYLGTLASEASTVAA